MKARTSILERETLLDFLGKWADAQPTKTAFTFLGKDGEEKDKLSFAELNDKARSVASALKAKNAAGQRVVLFFQPGLEFICAFFGCLYARAIAVPIPPPQGKRQIPRVNAILDDASPMIIVSSREIRQKLQQAGADRGISGAYEWLEYEEMQECPHDVLAEASGSDVAFLQYTSGSTSLPKGVMVTHANILRNEQIIAEAFEHDQQTVVAGWLPFYHDMGLIGNILQPIYLGAACVLMSPLTFLTEPVQWLRAISRYRATTSGGPNFAYQLCTAKIADDELDGLDLSSWKLAFNGSEPVHAQTMKAFSERFGRWGFDSRAFYPCYGMAECTLFATGGLAGEEISVANYQAGDRVPRQIEAVSCGYSRQGEEVRIVDPKTRQECPDGGIGEIWLKGESIALGYWNKPEATQDIFQASMESGEGPYLRTGDLGFKRQGHLYIAGRLKNMIIIRGRNLFPHDIEQAVSQSHPALHGCPGASFAIVEGTEEKLVVAQEVDRVAYRQYDPAAIFRNIRKAVADLFQLDIHAILLVKAGSLPRTTSGKLQHYLCRDMFLENALEPLNEEREPAIHAQNNTPLNGSVHSDTASAVIQFLSALLKVPAAEILLDETLPGHGVDSMKALQFAHWARKHYGIELEMEWLFDETSIEKIIHALSEGSGRIQPHVCPATLNQHAGRMELSFNQENLWAIHQMSPGDTSYNIPAVLHIKGAYDCAAFTESLQEVVRRHDALRMSVGMRDGAPCQVVHEMVSLLFSAVDLSGMEALGQRGQIDRHIQEETFTPFPLDQAPLFRTRALKLSENEAVLIFVFHHLVIDGWSFNILLNELRDIYKQKTLKKGEQIFPDETPSYQTYTQWQRSLEGTPAFDDARKYWKSYLPGESPILSLSKLQSPKPVKDLQGSVKFAKIEGDLFQALQRFNKARESTTAMTLLAAFHALVHGYSGENRVQIGYPSANRSHPDFAATLGFFVNTLVSKTCASESTTFSDVLGQVKSGLLSSLKHDFLPFQEIVKAVNPPRMEGISPLFQIMFVMQNGPSQVDGFPGLNIDIRPVEHLAPIYNLVLEAAQQDEAVSLAFEFKCGCLPEFLVDQFVRHYVNFLRSALAHPEQKLASMPYLADWERQRLIADWNNTEVKHGPATNVIDLIAEHVAQTPHASAVIGQGINWTYHELNQQANRVAAHLLKMGLGPRETVGFCLDRSPLLIAVMLGIIKAGGVYVPIDQNLPKERKQFILEDAGVRYLVLDRRYQEAFENFSGRVIDTEAVSLPSVEAPEIHRPSSTAYILYTSGSTGRPKGVVVAHPSLLNFTQAAIKLFGISSQDKVLQFASLSWDTCSEEIYPCLASGGALVLRSTDPVEAFDALLALTHRERVTVWDLPTSYWHDLTDYLASRNEALPESLRLLIVGGEKVSHRKVKDWERHYGRSVRLLNTYGATEATSISSACDLFDWPEGMDTPIGKPIDNVRMHVLNASLQPQPIGVAGDLYIAGSGVALEYRNLPELTAQKFLSDPFADDPHARIYKTGDIAYYVPSGDICLLGREDNQVKRRGYRIELEEIQRAIEEVPGVEKCLVLFKRESDKEARLNAYIIPREREGLAVLQEKVRSYLKAKLPDYMLPDEVLFLEEFPRLPNGKLDAKSFDQKAFKVEPKGMAPVASETEKTILEIWQEVLGHPVSDPHHSFFDVGGNSLSILKLHQKLNARFGAAINVSELFSHHTCAMQAKWIEAQKNANKPALSTLELLKQLEQGSVSLHEVKSQLNKKSA